MYHLRCQPASAAPIAVPRPTAARRPPSRRRPAVRRGWKALAAAAAGLALVSGIVVGMTGFRPSSREELRSRPVAPPPRAALRPLARTDVQGLIAGVNVLNRADSRVEFRHGQACFTLQTTLDTDLGCVLLA